MDTVKIYPGLRAISSIWSAEEQQDYEVTFLSAECDLEDYIPAIWSKGQDGRAWINASDINWITRETRRQVVFK